MCADRDRSAPAGHRAMPLYLMAKAPVPGEVKTRMAPRLDPEQSAQLAHLMLVQTVAAACRHWPGVVTLCVWPDPDHPAFTRLAAKHGIKVTTQIDADLGVRMMAALKQGIAHAGGAAVMGCDVPHCPGEILARAHALLVGGENPLGPAADGGFYLLGLQRGAGADESAGDETAVEEAPIEALFNGVRWGGSAQLDEVRARAVAAGLRFCELPTVRDIDRYPDLEWLAGIDDAYKRFVE